MAAERIHLVRHGEVHNPQRVLYGRLPGFRLSAAGRRGAIQAAEHVAASGRSIAGLVCSPLQRAQESAEPFVDLFDLEPTIDLRVIEPTNVFEGRVMRRAMMNPLNWRYLAKPELPSWGEHYLDVVARMDSAMVAAWRSVRQGDVVIVSHQLPIWVTHLSVAGKPLRHNPRKRRCALSSVTSFTRTEGRWQEVSYAEPAALQGTVDVGAV